MSVAGFNVVPSVLVVGASQLSVAAPELVTVRVALPETFPDTAVTAAVPAATAVANPFEPAALLSVATPVLAEFHVTDAVRSCVVLSEKEPVAVNCCVAPLVMDALAGVTVIEVSVAAVIVSVVDPDTLPDNALIVVEPVVTEVASPLEPAALLIVATPVDDELQVTDAVMSCVVLSE
jgi:hypothetical protein